MGSYLCDFLYIVLCENFERPVARKGVMAKFSHGEEWFRVTLASIGDAVIATDPGMFVTYMNPTAEKLTGWEIGEARGKPLLSVFNIVNEDTRELVESPVAKALRLGAVVGLANHTFLIARDGTERAIDDSAAPIRDEEGVILGVVMVFHDITERREAEGKLQVSETRYRRLFEAAHDGILILDAETRRITDVNPFMLKLLGKGKKEFVGKELWEIGLFANKDASQAAIDDIHARGSVRFEDMPLMDVDGLLHPVEVVANLYVEGGKRVIQCNIRDISVRKVLERDRRAAMANEQAARLEAESANRSKDVFLAMLSHEVRTPLNAILGWTRILRGEKFTDQDLAEGLEVIERNAQAQVQLIGDVMDVSRIVSGKMLLKVGACELRDVIGDAIDSVQAMADAKGVRITTVVDGEATRASCDASRIQQVLWNLLSNAIKFSSEGGAVEVRLARKGSVARMEVADVGIGIEASFLSSVFDRFRQADSSTRRQHGGLGLGLSIAKDLVELHGGTISAFSDGPGKGARFVVDLPARAMGAVGAEVEEDGRGMAGSADGHPRLDGVRVMVVDDEADARRLVEKVLAGVGAVLSIHASVDEALLALEAFVPEILVSDIAMPLRDGYDLIREVRAAGYSARQLPAIALTAFAHREDRRKALRAGFQLHISKPVDPYDLSELIAGLAGRTTT